MKSNSLLFSNYTLSADSRPSEKSWSGIGEGKMPSKIKTKKKSKKASVAAKASKGNKTTKRPLFTKKGHVTLRSIAARREFFLGKSVARIEHELRSHGYEVTRRHSKHPHSKAKIILTLNSSKYRNIRQIQISPGSGRHGNVPYVKISTSDYGKIKIIGADRKSYKTDGKEKATIFYRRMKKK